MKDPEMPDWSVIGWLGPVAVAVVTAAIGHLHVRVNRVEDAARSDRKDLLGAIAELRDDLKESDTRATERRHDLNNQITGMLGAMSTRIDRLMEVMTGRVAQ